MPLTPFAGPYYATGFTPITLLADPQYVRAWPGGVGATKCGGNYGPTIVPAVEAARRGAQQILWLGENEAVTEVCVGVRHRPCCTCPDCGAAQVGTSNLFVLWKTKDGETELVTAPLDGIVLPGVTRQTVLDLARKWGDMKVSEREYTMPELREAVKEGRVIEMFGSGTAVTVCPVRQIIVRLPWRGASLPSHAPCYP